MTCVRCQGLMIQQQIIDSHDEWSEGWISVLRCLNCGEILDSLVLNNRKNRFNPSYSRTRFRTGRCVTKC